MTKKDLLAAVSTLEVSKAATKDIVERVFKFIGQAVRGKRRFSYPDFGSLIARERAAREGLNPQTGKKIQIPAHRTVIFRPAVAFKKAL